MFDDGIKQNSSQLTILFRYLCRMDMPAIRRALQEALIAQRTNAYRAALAAGLPQEAIRQVINGHEPRAGRLSEICRALGLEFYVGPRRGPTADQPAPAMDQLDSEPISGKPVVFDHGGELPSQAPFEGVLRSAIVPIADREIAAVIAALADEYEELDEPRRVGLLTRFWSFFPDLRGRTESSKSRRLARMMRDFP